MKRTQGIVFVQVFLSSGRTTEQKKAFYRRIVEKLKDNPWLRPEDVFINLVEVARENWSFGNGIAQYAPDKT